MMRWASFSLTFALLFALACSGVTSGAPGRKKDAAVADTDAQVDADAAAADGGSGGRMDSGLPAEDAARGTIRGVVYGVAAADLRRLRVSAGGDAISVSDTGFFELTDALAGPSTQLLADAADYSSGQLGVPVLPDEVAHAIVWLTPMRRQTVDLTEDANVDLGAPGAALELELAAQSLETVYGTPARGFVEVQAAMLPLLGAPGGTLLARGAERMRFSSLGMVEVRARQATAALVLTNPATLSFSALPPRGSAADATVDVYRFDPNAGVFRFHAQGQYLAASGTVRVEIDRFGIYAAGESLAEPTCVEMIVADSLGTPMRDAAIVYASQREGGFVTTDRVGSACLPAEPDADLMYRAFGSTSEGLFEVIATGPEHAPSAALACGDSACLDLGFVKGKAPATTCVRGTLAPAAQPTDVYVSLSSMLPPHVFRTGDDFCVDARMPTQITFESLSLDCGAARTISTPKKPTRCATGGCVDLGTITCSNN